MCSMCWRRPPRLFLILSLFGRGCWSFANTPAVALASCLVLTRVLALCQHPRGCSCFFLAWMRGLALCQHPRGCSCFFPCLDEGAGCRPQTRPPHLPPRRSRSKGRAGRPPSLLPSLPSSLPKYHRAKHPQHVPLQQSTIATCTTATIYHCNMYHAPVSLRLVKYAYFHGFACAWHGRASGFVGNFEQLFVFL